MRLMLAFAMPAALFIDAQVLPRKVLMRGDPVTLDQDILQYSTVKSFVERLARKVEKALMVFF